MRELIRRQLACGLSVCALVTAAACGDRPHSPMAPAQADLPSITADVAPSPVPMRLRTPSPGGGLRNYDVSAQLNFRHKAGPGARIKRIELIVMYAGGNADRQMLDVDLALSGAGALVSQTVAGSFQIAPDAGAVRWRILAFGTDDSGRPFDVAPLEIPLALETAIALSSAPDAVFVGAGDIGNCGDGDPEATARLLDGIPGTVFTLGDNAYPSATAERLAKCYGPTWGRHLGRTRPAPGNHEWEEASGAPYFAYFGPNAGPGGRGYYSFDLGAWHIVSLNANIGAGPTSAQMEWLRADIASHPSSCTLAYWHDPVFSSGIHGNSPRMKDVWRFLDNAGADVVLTAHDHGYERFAPQDADGRSDPAGMRSFVVGTGGAPESEQTRSVANSEIRNNAAWGVLKLTLRSQSYAWEFMPVKGRSFSDAGTAECSP